MSFCSYAYIYTSNGVSLHELAVSLSKGRKYSANDNDDLCIICADGGNLVLCDGCPRAFHKGRITIVLFFHILCFYVSFLFGLICFQLLLIVVFFQKC